MDPARMFKESLTSRPELENSQGQEQTSRAQAPMSVLLLEADIDRSVRKVCLGPEAEVVNTQRSAHRAKPSTPSNPECRNLRRTTCK